MRYYVQTGKMVNALYTVKKGVWSHICCAKQCRLMFKYGDKFKGKNNEVNIS